MSKANTTIAQFLEAAKSGPTVIKSSKSAEATASMPRTAIERTLSSVRETLSEVIFRSDSSNDADVRFPCRWLRMDFNLVTILSSSTNLGHPEQVANMHLYGFDLMTDSSGKPLQKENHFTGDIDDVYLVEDEEKNKIEAFLVPDEAGYDKVIDANGNQYGPRMLMEFRFYFGRADKSPTKSPKNLALLGITGNRGVPMKSADKFDSNGNKLDDGKNRKSTNIDYTAIPGMQGLIEGFLVKTAATGSPEEQEFIAEFKDRITVQAAYQNADGTTKTGLQRPVAAQVPTVIAKDDDPFKGEPED